MTIFATAHSRVFKNAEIEYIYESHFALFEYKHMLLRVPPPFNLVYIIYRVTAVSLRRVCLSAARSYQLLRKQTTGGPTSTSTPPPTEESRCTSDPLPAFRRRTSSNVFRSSRTSSKLFRSPSNGGVLGENIFVDGTDAIDERISVTIFVEGYLKAEADKEQEEGNIKALQRQLVQMKQQQTEMRADLAARLESIEGHMERMANESDDRRDVQAPRMTNAWNPRTTAVFGLGEGGRITRSDGKASTTRNSMFGWDKG